MKKIYTLLLLFCVLFGTASVYRWGFFGHKRINRLAVFTVPTPLVGFYKKNISFLTEHAVDPDMRRYAVKAEAPRHFMDLDRYGKAPFDQIPRQFNEALTQFIDLYGINQKGDTLHLMGPSLQTKVGYNLRVASKDLKKITKQDTLTVAYNDWRQLVTTQFVPTYYDDEHPLAIDTLADWFKKQGIIINLTAAFFEDHFSEHGILPYNLVQTQRRLTKAFEEKNLKKILQTSADLGHYIGDAHVPLHTTENYNGQLTNQLGIHGFWESRLPELFADAEYDFFLGKATYIRDPETYYWNIILESHKLVDSVLLIDKDLSRTFPQDQIFAFDDRNGVVVRTQSRAYSKAYHDRLDGMVEARMRAAILAVGCAWFTAWTDAGQPDLDFSQPVALSPEEEKERKAEEEKMKSGSIIGREHDN